MAVGEGGCLPGGVCPGEVSAQGDLPGGCPGGVCQGRGCLSREVCWRCLPGVVSAQGGLSAQGVVCPGVSALGGRCVCQGGCLPQCMLGCTPQPNRIIDACEEHNLAATMLRTVTRTTQCCALLYIIHRGTLAVLLHNIGSARTYMCTINLSMCN